MSAEHEPADHNLVEPGVCLLDEAGRFTFVDARAATLLGASASAGADVRAVLPWLPVGDDERVSRTGEVGNLRVRATYTRTPGAGAAAVATLVVQVVRAVDVVSRELETAKQNLRSLVDASPVAILTLDLNRDVTMWNPAAEAMFGWTSAEVLGRPYPLVPESEWDSFSELFERVIRGEGFTGVEGTRARKDGVDVELRIHTAPMRSASGEVVGALALLEDLSDRKRLEERVRHSQKMEAVGRLAGGVAHDFNNLLTVILGMSDLLLSKGDALPEYATRGIGDISECANRARKLTAQLLAFSRRQVLQPEVADLNGLVLETSRLLRRVIGEEIQLLLDLDENPVLVCVDNNQFDQMLVNLAVNARDAMPDGGSLTLHTRVVDWSSDPEGPTRRFAALDVHDTGEGIDPGDLERIFDPFFTTKDEGTGLGLSTVYGIAEQSGGSVQACSDRGEGTVFRILLPLVQGNGDGAPRRTGEEAPPAAGSERVLLVEDDSTVRDVTKRMLARLGYQVTTARDGEDALSVLEGLETPPDLLLTDLSMPRMGGRALAEAVANRHPTLPIVFMSAHLDLPELRARVEAGQAAFLQKPASLRQIASTIRDVLDGSRASAKG